MTAASGHGPSTIAAAAQLPIPGSRWRMLHRAVLMGILTWIGVGLAAQLLLVATESRVAWVDLLFDDAYYDLGVAWNLAHGHGSRFSAPLQTNGYHPLWLLMLTGLAALLDLSKSGLVVATLVLTAALKALGIVCFGAEEAVTRRGAAWRTAGRLAIFVAIVKYPLVYSAGLETTLFLLFIPWLLAAAKRAGWSVRHALVVGLLMSAAFLSRLDALALDVAVLFVAWATRRVALQRAAVALAPLLLTMTVYALSNVLLFDTPVPVSGQAKAIGSRVAANLGTTLYFLRQMKWTVAVLAVAWAARSIAAARPRVAGFEMACLALAAIACGVYYGVLSGWPVWDWYLYPVAWLLVYATLSALLALAAVAATLHARAVRRWPHGGAGRGAGAVVAGLVVTAAAGLVLRVLMVEHEVLDPLLARAHGHDPHDRRRSSFNQQNLLLLPWLEQHYPRGASIAMGDRAGGLGYWLPERYTLLQTEGLVGDKAFLRVLADGELAAFLPAHRLDLYISDRPRTFAVDGVLGFVEPAQARVTDGPVNLLCFAERDAVRSDGYDWHGTPQRRHVFEVTSLTACPPALQQQVRSLRLHYDGVRSAQGL